MKLSVAAAALASKQLTSDVIQSKDQSSNDTTEWKRKLRNKVSSVVESVKSTALLDS